jgi:Ran GTPase-activating protein (RanGAP) involved in mRNA processing and transport
VKNLIFLPCLIVELQENLKFALDLVQKLVYLTSVDLCDAYFSIQIHPEFQKYLRFSWRYTLNSPISIMTPKNTIF